MDVFIARQPIFDINNKVFAYELLYRSGVENVSKFKSGDSATSDVVINSLLLLGLEQMTEGKMAFINFTEGLIKDEIPQLFSRRQLVVELLEDIVPDKELLARVRILKELGYTIALDDYIASYEYDELVELADIIKIDFVGTSALERVKISKRFIDMGKKLLAEKVETLEEFNEAKALGYTYFQGYYFAKPRIMKGKDVVGLNMNYMRIIDELNQEEPQYEKISAIIENDLALTYKLLRLINSPAFYTNSKVTSAKHALVLLGLKEIKKWIMILMLREAGKDKPDAVLKTCLFRAKMAETVAAHTGLSKRRNELFIMGLFSMIDTLLGQDLMTIIETLPFEDDVKAAMLGVDNKIKDIFITVVLYEQGNWEALMKGCEKIGVNYFDLPDMYYNAVLWADQVFSGTVVE